MEAKDVKNLMEAYASVYDFDQEELNEGMGLSVGAAKLMGKLASNPRTSEAQATQAAQKNITDPIGFAVKNAARTVLGVGSNKNQQMMQKRRPLNQDISLFDIIKGHLIDEGYADTEESALAIMANMSEEWKQSIVEATGDVNPAIGGNPLMMVGGKPLSLKSDEFKWVQIMNKLKREDPNKYKEVQSLMGPQGWKQPPAGMKVPKGL